MEESGGCPQGIPPYFEAAAFTISSQGWGVRNSTYKGSTYATLSGTSMASPHAAGTAALVIASGQGNVRAVLQGTADDLGTVGRDSLYGYGLVDAQQAATGVQTLP